MSNNVSSVFPPNPRFPVPEGELSVNIYGYTPSKVLGFVGVIVFILTLIAHIFWLFKYRSTRTFQALVAFTCACEAVGYGARLAAAGNPYLLISFILQYFFIVVSPVFLSAALYWALSVIIRSKPDFQRLSPLSPKLILAIFCFFDAITIVAQVLGAAFIGAAESAEGRGDEPFITAENSSLAVQSAAFLVFLIIFAIFIARLQKASLIGRAPHQADPVLLATLMGTSLLIYMRTLFRLAESAPGLLSYIARNQTLFGVFESMPIMLVVLWWAVIPLGRFTESLRAQGRDPEKTHI
ncbi:hypothetical protein V8E36_001986 [Tilletia maclaganii]